MSKKGISKKGEKPDWQHKLPGWMEKVATGQRLPVGACRCTGVECKLDEVSFEGLPTDFYGNLVGVWVFWKFENERRIDRLETIQKKHITPTQLRSFMNNERWSFFGEERVRYILILTQEHSTYNFTFYKIEREDKKTKGKERWSALEPVFARVVGAGV